MSLFFPPAIMEIQVIAGEAITKVRELNAELAVLERQSIAAGAAIGKFEKTAAFMAGTLKVTAFAVAAIGVFSVKAAMDAEPAFARMETAIKNAGLATEETQKAAKELTETNVKLGFDTVETANAYGTLITATHNTHDAQMLLNSAMDLSRYKHIDLATSATILARGTQGSAKAFKELGITLDSSLPKQDAINKAFDELNKKLSGQNAAYLETFSGKMSVLGAQAKLAGEKIGTFLIPYLTKLMDFLTKFGPTLLTVGAGVIAFALTFKAVEVAVGLATVANAYYAAGLAAVMEAEAVLAVETAGLAAAEGGLTIATRLATGAMGMLNLAMDANPIGAVVVVVAALVLGLKALFGWLNKNTDATKQLAGATGNGAGRTFGRGASATTGGYMSINATGGGPTGLPSDFANWQNTTSDSFHLTSYTGATKLTAAQQAALDAAKKKKEDLIKYKADVQAIYKDMNKVIKDAAEETSTLIADKKENDLAINQDYLRQLSVLERGNKQELFRVNRDYQDSKDKLNRSHEDAYAAAQQTYNRANEAANDTFLKSKLAAEKNYADAMSKIQKDYNDKVTSAYEKAATDRLSIVKQSIALLTNAFSGATGVDIGSMFASSFTKDNALANTLVNQVKGGISTVVSWWGTQGKQGVDGLLSDLKTKLNSAKTLADNAAKLAAQGYSQTFIQQIVSQGAGIGNQMADAILSASPEAQGQLKDLYAQIQNVSETGVTALATQMNSGATLATKELTNAYAQVTVDLQNALSVAAQQLREATDSENKTLSEALIAAGDTLRKALASSDLALKDSMASADLTLKEGLADAKKTYDDKLFDMKTTLDNNLQDAEYALQQALLSSQKSFDKNLASIQKNMMQKLADLQDKLKETAALIAGISGQSAGVKITANSPAASYLAGTATQYPSSSNSALPYNYSQGAGSGIIVNVGGITTTNPDPSLIVNPIVSAIKFGTVGSVNKMGAQ